MTQQIDKCILCDKEDDIDTLRVDTVGVCQSCYSDNYPPEYIVEDQRDKYWKLLIRKKIKP